MELNILFAQRKEQYEGEYAPEAIAVETEYDEEENGGQFMAGEIAKAENNPDYVSLRVIRVAVDGDKIRKLLLQRPLVSGSVLGPADTP